MCYRKLYILLLVLPVMLMAEITTKVLQRGLDGYDGAQDAELFWRFKTDDRNGGSMSWDTAGVNDDYASGELSASEKHY